jgi:hypothetical protein
VLNRDISIVELLTQKQKLLKDAIVTTSEKLEALKMAQERYKTYLDYFRIPY